MTWLRVTRVTSVTWGTWVTRATRVTRVTWVTRLSRMTWVIWMTSVTRVTSVTWVTRIWDGGLRAYGSWVWLHSLLGYEFPLGVWGFRVHCVESFKVWNLSGWGLR